MGSDGVRRSCDEAEIGFVILIEGSRDADDDGVHGSDLRVVGSRGKPLGAGRLDFRRSDAIDIRAALAEGVDLASVDIEAGDRELLLAVQQGERQADVAEADDAHSSLALLNLSLQLIKRGVCGRVSGHEIFSRLVRKIGCVKSLSF
jgi:hypothetical protein